MHPSAKPFPFISPKLTRECASFSKDTFLLRILNRNHPLRRSWRTFSLLLPQKKMLFNALPFDVCWFLVYRDRMGKTQPHHKRCQYVGQWGIFTCSCPRWLAYGTVDSHIHPFEQSHLTYLCSRVSATSCSHAPLPYSAFQVCLRSGAQTSAPHSSAGETSVNRMLLQKNSAPTNLLLWGHQDVPCC